MSSLTLLYAAAGGSYAGRNAGRRASTRRARCSTGGRTSSPPSRPGSRRSACSMDGTLDEPQWKQAAVLTGFSQFAPRDGIAGRGLHRGAGLVLADRDPLRRPRLRAARGGARRPRRPRQDLQRRPRRAAPRHLPRRAPGHGARRQSARRADGRHARGEQPGARRRLREHDEQPRISRSQPRLHLPVEGTAHSVRLRGRDPRSVQEPQVPERRDADVGRSTSCASCSIPAREDSWAPARRANASFLAQSGTLEGLTELRAGSCST